MKNLKASLAFIAAFFFIVNQTLLAQDKQVAKPRLTVLNIDTKGVNMEPRQMGNLVRIELEKLNLYDVTDRYDVAYLIEKNNLKVDNCYGKLCLVELGQVIQSDYMFTGSAELYGETIIITFRVVDVKSKGIERTAVMEFLNFPLEIQTMATLTIRKLFDMPLDQADLTRLTKKFNYENTTNNPNKNMVNLQGPRFGYMFMFGENANVLKAPAAEGGFDAYPALFQFGYQFEKQYLNEGDFQALFEFIPMVSGIDQQMFIPSITLLNGFRNTHNGWELAIGPTFSLIKSSQMAYYNGKYYTASELNAMNVANYETSRRLNSKGDFGIGSALVFGVGKTFKSGKMNIPLNFFFTLPNQEGFKLGVSVGYNSKNNP